MGGVSAPPNLKLGAFDAFLFFSFFGLVFFFLVSGKRTKLKSVNAPTLRLLCGVGGRCSPSLRLILEGIPYSCRDLSGGTQQGLEPHA